MFRVPMIRIPMIRIPMIRIRRLAGLALALACAACVPPAAGGEAGAAAPAGAGVRLLNEEEGLRVMDRNFDELLRDAGVTGEARVDLTLNADGTVSAARVMRWTHERFIEPARRAGRTLRFSPPPAPGTVVRVRMDFIYGRGRIVVEER